METSLWLFAAGDGARANEHAARGSAERLRMLSGRSGELGSEWGGRARRSGDGPGSGDSGTDGLAERATVVSVSVAMGLGRKGRRGDCRGLRHGAWHRRMAERSSNKCGTKAVLVAGDDIGRVCCQHDAVNVDEGGKREVKREIRKRGEASVHLRCSADRVRCIVHLAISRRSITMKEKALKGRWRRDDRECGGGTTRKVVEGRWDTGGETTGKVVEGRQGR